MEYITLNNGLKMPLLGFGTMNIFDEEECTKVLKEAYDAGYRLFDCAQIYGNEEVVGNALKKAGIDRKDIFLTTKVWFTNYEGEDVRKSLLESMRKLKTDYFDLVFSIGISNYQESQYLDLIHFNKVVPVVNQIKVTLRCQRKHMNEVMKERGTVLQGYQVFGKEETLAVYEDEKVKEMALKYHKTTRQIAMKYLVQNGISVITRPMQKQWMKDNLNLFDFELSETEMNYLASFDMLEYNTRPSQDYQRTLSMLEK